MCAQCSAFVSSDDRVCPYCNAPLSSRSVARTGTPGDVMFGIIPAARFTTIMILLVNFALYAATTLITMKLSEGGFTTDIPGQVLLAFGAKHRAAIFQGHEWWRLVTAGFLHGGIFHLLMNSWVLFDLGATVEEYFGTSRMLVIYFVGTVLGFLASCYWTSALSIGSSAGIFGLIGAMIAFGTRDKTSYGRQLRSVFVRWAAYSLLIGVVLVAVFPVDNAAHVGGLAGGFLVGYAASDRSARQPAWVSTLWTGLASVCLLITVLSFALMFLNFTRVAR